MSSADGIRRRRREAPAEQTFADLMNGFSLDSGRRKQRKPSPPPTPAQVHVEEWPPEPAPAPSAAPAESTAAIVRAYTWTGGRTRSTVNLEIETLVSANDQGYHSAGMLQAEHQRVIELCHAPRSVAEVAALMRLPLGVAKVLLGDLAERGLVDVHLTATSAGADSPDLGLMERVLSGLRRL